jgi:hypothetical protein
VLGVFFLVPIYTVQFHLRIMLELCSNYAPCLSFSLWGRSQTKKNKFLARDLNIFFMFPWKDFLKGRIRKFQKRKEERDRSGKNSKKTRRKEWRKEKEENFFFPICGGSHSRVLCSPLVGNTLRLVPSCNPPSREPTCMGP